MRQRPSIVSTNDPSFGFELTKRLTQILISDAKESSQLKLSLRSARFERIEDT